MAPDAPGLRAMPSHAEDATRDCASAPPNAASAIPNAAEIATQFVPPAAAPAAVCANAAGLASIAIANVYRTFLFVSSYEIPAKRWLHHPPPTSGPTLIQPS